MSLSPKKIYELYNSKKINKNIVLDYFISFVENSDDDKKREMSIKYIKDIDIKTRKLFNFLENLLTSDSNFKIRGLAGQIIISRYFEKSKKLVNRAFDNIQSELCISYLIDGLSKTNDEDALRMLINLIHRYNKEPLVATVINAIYNRADDKNIIFDILLNEYWKIEKIEVRSSTPRRNGKEIVINGETWSVYESNTLLQTPVKDAIENAIIRIFLEKDSERKL